MTDVTQATEISYFNASQLQIQRLNHLWELCIDARLKYEVDRYRSVLLAVFLELVADMTDEQHKLCKKYQLVLVDIANIKVKLTNPSKYNITPEENDKRVTIEHKNNKMFCKLLPYEVLLKKIEKSEGKGLRYKDDEDEEVD